MKFKRYISGVIVVASLAACGPTSMDSQMNEAAATVASRMNEAFPSEVANDPTAQALANEVQATIEAAANDPTTQAQIDEAMATMEAVANDPTALALANDPTAQALANEVLATAEAAANDPTARALVNDPTAQAIANEAIATIQAAANDPTAQALAATAIASVSETNLQTAVDAVLASVGPVTVEQGQALTLEALSYIPNITNYRMTVVTAPAGAEAAEGKVIKEASDGNISLTPEEYEKYFTVAGDYTIRLDLTSSGQTASNDFTITMP